MVDRHSDSGWLLHIGAGLSSVNALRHARAHGLRTLAVDVDPNAPGLAYATQTIERSRDDLVGILTDVRAFASEHLLSGCSTTSSAAAALDVAAAIREEHDLPGLRSTALTTLADRSLWKERLARRSIPTPASQLISTPEQLDDFLREQPCILVKPESGGRGSLGVGRVRGGDVRSRDLYDEARDHSSSGLVLAEAFVSGDEYSIDGIIRDGEFQMLHLGRKFSARNLRGTLPTGYAWGALRKGIRCDDDPRWNEYQALASAAGAALEMNDTFMSLDVIDDGERTFIIDVGCQLDAKVDRGLEFSGFDVAELDCAIATGRPSQLGPEPGALTRGYAIRFLYADSDGCLDRPKESELQTLDSTSHHWQAIQMPAHRTHIEWEKKLNAPLRRPRSVSDLVVCVLVEAEDRNRAWMRCNEIEGSSLFTVRQSIDDPSSDTNTWNAGGSNSS